MGGPKLCEAKLRAIAKANLRISLDTYKCESGQAHVTSGSQDGETTLSKRVSTGSPGCVGMARSERRVRNLRDPAS